MIIEKLSKSETESRRRLWKEAFGDSDAFLDDFDRTAFSPERYRAVTIDGEVVCALYFFDCEYSGERVAYIYAVATSKAYRGQGLCRRLFDETHAYLSDRGYTGAILCPGSDSLFDFYKSMGYVTCSSVREFDCTAGEKVEICRIGSREYADLRRKYLPAGGVVQEGEGIEFLSTYADFYKGDNFVLAVRVEKDKLFGIELLGDVDAALGITSALGFKNGRFRVPGDGKPFAMYRALGGSKHPAPAYFGLAFD